MSQVADGQHGWEEASNEAGWAVGVKLWMVFSVWACVWPEATTVFKQGPDLFRSDSSKSGAQGEAKHGVVAKHQLEMGRPGLGWTCLWRTDWILWRVRGGASGIPPGCRAGQWHCRSTKGVTDPAGWWGSLWAQWWRLLWWVLPSWMERLFSNVSVCPLCLSPLALPTSQSWELWQLLQNEEMVEPYGEAEPGSHPSTACLGSKEMQQKEVWHGWKKLAHRCLFVARILARVGVFMPGHSIMGVSPLMRDWVSSKWVDLEIPALSLAFSRTKHIRAPSFLGCMGSGSMARQKVLRKACSPDSRERRTQYLRKFYITIMLL